MPLDYEEVKRFFYDKLTHDLEGKGRMESALYHTAMWIYQKGIDDKSAEIETIKSLTTQE